MIWLVTVIGAYLLTAMILPIGQQTPIVDEPIYASAAFEFADTGAIKISDYSAPNAVLETVWGGFAAKAWGSNLGSIRLATIVFTALSAPFLYLLCRSLGGSKSLSVVGTATYLFTPLAFSLTHAFHTDPYSVGLMVIAMSLMTQAFPGGRNSMTWLALGSATLAIAYLSRPQILAVVATAAIAWMLWGDRSRRWHGLAVLLVPAVLVYMGHSAWTSATGEPYIRALSREDLLNRGIESYLKVTSEAALVTGIYVGLFVLPLIPAAIPRFRLFIQSVRNRWGVYSGAALAATTAALILSGRGPFHLQAWVTGSGLGAVDRSHLGQRPSAPYWIMALVTIALAGSCYIFLARLRSESSQVSNPGGFRFVAITGIGLLGAAVLSSVGLHVHLLDRYLFPLVPIAISLAVSIGITTRIRLSIATVLVVCLGVFSVLATHDAYSTYRAANDFAALLIENGIPSQSLDGGASWSGAYFGVGDDAARSLKRGGPFWMQFYSVDSTPEFGIALEPLSGYEILDTYEYQSILHPGADELYLVRRDPSLGFYLRPEDL